MIDYLKGVLTIKELGYVTIEVHGIGYGASISLTTYEQLPVLKSDVLLYTHYYVREDAHKLFGFISRNERELFRQLISISKIGPKVALNVLSGVSAGDLVQSVNCGDPTTLHKIPGIGQKTAQRLVMELKGKLGLLVTTAGKKGVSASSSTNVTGDKVVRDEVFAAMISLGYNERQVNRALDRIQAEMQNDDPVEVWIRKALQVI